MIVRKINWPAAKNCQDEQKGLETTRVNGQVQPHSIVRQLPVLQYSATFTNTVCDLNIV